MDIDKYISSFRNEIDNFDETVAKIVIANKGWLLSRLKLRLYQRGLDGNLQSLGTYSKRHAEYRKSQNLRTSHVTLKFRGGFWDGMDVEVEKTSLFIESSDWKNDLLVSQYGEAILENTEQELRQFVDQIIEPELLKIFRNLGDIG